MHRWSVIGLCWMVVGVGCVDDDVDVPSSRDEFEDALFDFLACDDRASPSTLARLREVIDDPTTDNAIALVTAPEELASLVSMAGPQVELTVIVLQNLRLAAVSGHGAELIADGWDGLTCGDVLPVACTAGTAVSTVTCDVGQTPDGVVVAWASCVLSGTRFDGDLIYAREADGSASLSGDDFTIDEVRAIDGAFAVAIAGGNATDIRATDVNGVAFVSYGGPDGGLSCGERLQADVAVVDIAAAAVHVELDGTHVTVDGVTGVKTTGSHITVSDVRACPCPDAGSALQLAIDDVAGTNSPGIVDVSWVGNGSGDGCRSVRVQTSTWPTSCTGFGDDCGQQAIAETLEGLLTAFCFPVP